MYAVQFQIMGYSFECYPELRLTTTLPCSPTLHHPRQIAVMGRTGAGKSTLVLALLRFYDFAGTIRIDNVDTKSAWCCSLGDVWCG